MEAALVRTFLLVCLGALLLADFTAILSRVTSALGSQAGADVPPPPPPREHEKGAQEAAKYFNKKEKLAQIATTIKDSCLPKLICELNAAPEKDKLTQKEKSLLQLIKDTSMTSTAESSSRYHFAAHMGQLIAGIEGTGCHNFYPGCPLPSVKVLGLMNKPSGF